MPPRRWASRVEPGITVNTVSALASPGALGRQGSRAHKPQHTGSREALPCWEGGSEPSSQPASLAAAVGSQSHRAEGSRGVLAGAQARARPPPGSSPHTHPESISHGVAPAGQAGRKGAPQEPHTQAHPHQATWSALQLEEPKARAPILMPPSGTNVGVKPGLPFQGS